MQSTKIENRRWFLYAVVVMMGLSSACTPTNTPTEEPATDERRNVIFILVDDQRYDAMGFLNPLLETPNMDRLAAEGVFFRNAFVTTALCSPSRATILTSQYMHNHGIVDNNEASTEGLTFFPEYLQRSGYETAFVGKWHMGEASDAPQRGFDHWVSFEGQGDYFPGDRPDRESVLNVNGESVPQRGYITDELTDYALSWLGDEREPDKPFFLYLSHKAVHADFYPAEAYRERYADALIELPASAADTEENYAGKPMWVRNQRNSWHGVDFPYHSDLDVREYLRRYYQTLSSVDDSLGRVLAFLEANDLASSTTILFMGDNGFLFGEHGLIDKRNAYEESMRVPLLAYGPGQVPAGVVVESLAANLDIAPTVLDIAGVQQAPDQFEGVSLLPAISGDESAAERRDEFLYEYYWEYDFPHTPTTFAIRTPEYKLIQYHGVWDTEELYDMVSDPKEMTNRIDDPELSEVKATLRHRLFELLENRDREHVVPYTEKKDGGAVLRHGGRSKAAEFPEAWLR
jgi:N-acetylglucosamine-6-sulfatase